MKLAVFRKLCPQMTRCNYYATTVKLLCNCCATVDGLSQGAKGARISPISFDISVSVQFLRNLSLCGTRPLKTLNWFYYIFLTSQWSADCLVLQVPSVSYSELLCVAVSCNRFTSPLASTLFMLHNVAMCYRVLHNVVVSCGSLRSRQSWRRR